MAAAPGPAPTAARPAPTTAAPPAGTVGTSAPATDLALTPPPRTPSTPRLMLGLLTLCVAVVVLFTTVAVGSLVSARSELSGATHSVEELIRVNEIRTELFRADSAATHAYLNGADSSDSDAADALGNARVLLVDAARAEPRDQDALEEVNRGLDAYVATLERARMAQGTLLGVSALAEAGDLLRTKVLPPLAALSTDNSARVVTQTGGFPGYLLVATGVLAVAALLTLWVAAAIRFRRVVNPGVFGALLLVVGSFVVSGTVLLQTDGAVRDTARHSIPVLRATSEARAHGYDAHARAALSVLAQTPAPSAQQPWDTAAAETRQNLDRPVVRDHAPQLTTLWSAYEKAHAQVREDALAGRWEAAAAAVAAGNQAFSGFDEAAATVTTDTAQTVRHELQQPRNGLLLGSIASALAGLGAIAAAVAGLRPRLREYR